MDTNTSQTAKDLTPPPAFLNGSKNPSDLIGNKPNKIEAAKPVLVDAAPSAPQNSFFEAIHNGTSAIISTANDYAGKAVQHYDVTGAAVLAALAIGFLGFRLYG